MFRCNLDRVGHLAKMFSPPGNAIGFRQLVGRETYRDKIISFQHQITLNEKRDPRLARMANGKGASLCRRSDTQ